MALKKAYTKYAVSFNDAYHRIREIHGGKAEGWMVSVDIYIDSDAAAVEDHSKILGGFNAVKEYDPESSVTLLQECYVYLKTLSEYEGAQDV